LPSKRPTIDDVAALAGVARVTVSRVLNGNPNVRDRVRDKVMAAVDMLQYKVNVQARALAGGRMHVLALVTPSDLEAEPNSFYHSGLELGALRACTELGVQLVVQAVRETAPDRTAKILDLIDSGACVGMVLTPPFSDDLELIDALKARQAPVVLISAGPEASARCSGVRIDDEAAGYDVARHLLSLGHRRFGYIRGIADHLSAEERFKGFRRALAEEGLGDGDYVVAQGNFTFRSGVDHAAAFLAEARPPTAIVCANDDMAVGALFSAHRLGLAIPGEISITGFDDTPISEIIWPPLTTIHHPIKTIGYEAARLVMAEVNSGGLGSELRCETIPHRLVKRDTSAPPHPDA
jgi:LacI family transcriptional regulator